MITTELLDLLKQTNQFHPNADVSTKDVVDAIESLQITATEYQQAADKMAMEHKVERDTLRQQLSEAQALIEASRNQEPVAWKYTHVQSWHTKPLFAAPIVADDVLKDAQRYRWLRSKTLLKTLPLVRVQIMNQGSYALQQGKELDALIDKAMGGSA